MLMVKDEIYMYVEMCIATGREWATCYDLLRWDEAPEANGRHSETNANERRCRGSRQQVCQSANHGSALVALRPSLTS